jgi:hypothetical protein
MKNLLTLLLLIAVSVSACDSSNDGKIILTEDREYYKLEWRIGGCYLLQPIDTTYLRIKNFPKK